MKGHQTLQKDTVHMQAGGRGRVLSHVWEREIKELPVKTEWKKVAIKEFGLGSIRCSIRVVERQQQGEWSFSY